MFKINTKDELIKFIFIILIVVAEHVVFSYRLSIGEITISNDGDTTFWFFVLFQLFIGLNMVTIFINYAMASTKISLELLGLTLLSCIGAVFNMATLKMIILYLNT